MNSVENFTKENDADTIFAGVLIIISTHAQNAVQDFVIVQCERDSKAN